MSPESGSYAANAMNIIRQNTIIFVCTTNQKFQSTLESRAAPTASNSFAETLVPRDFTGVNGIVRFRFRHSSTEMHIGCRPISANVRTTGTARFHPHKKVQIGISSFIFARNSRTYLKRHRTYFIDFLRYESTSPARQECDLFCALASN